MIGDELDRTVTWKSFSDVSSLAGTSVKLKFQLRDADLYALQFKHSETEPQKRGASSNERYKALGFSKTDDDPKTGGRKYLFVLKSPDGINWTPMQCPKTYGAVLDQKAGGFDSQNVAFWDSTAECYRLFFRKRREVTTRPELANREGGEGDQEVKARVRDIKTATSDDCLNWSQPEFLSYPGSPDEELYTNQVELKDADLYALQFG